MKLAALYLVSTPLHLLVASAIALKKRQAEEISYLAFIDQKNVDSHPYFNCIKQWSGSPFRMVSLYEGTGHLSALRKLRSRKAIFFNLEDLIKDIHPKRVYVGNDRRIEFQYIMHLASQESEVQGVYMDEGMFTYVGRQESGSFADRVIDNSLKKMAYGRWWDNPPTIGGSGWINEAYIAFPDLVHPLLRKKKITHLDASYFSAPEIKDLARVVLEYYKLDHDRLSKLDLLLTLPHESVMARIKNYSANIEKLVLEFSHTGKHVGIKDHPRNQGDFAASLGKYSNVWIIPPGAAFETFLPLLKSPVIIGDMSSTLLTTRWLRPDLTVWAIENPNSEYFAQFKNLFGSLNIEIKDMDSLTKI